MFRSVVLGKFVQVGGRNFTVGQAMDVIQYSKVRTRGNFNVVKPIIDIAYMRR